MAREEEIKIYLKERNIPFNSLEANSIIEGAKWADETMIDKACKWLENRHNIEKSLGILTSRTEDLSKAFKQAMEDNYETLDMQRRKR